MERAIKPLLYGFLAALVLTFFGCKAGSRYASTGSGETQDRKLGNDQDALGQSGNPDVNSASNGDDDDDDDDDDDNNDADGDDEDGDDSDDDGDAFNDDPEDGPEVFNLNFRESDEYFTLMDGTIAGNSPHGEVQIWYSENLRDLVGRGDFEAPEGSVAIKQFKNDDGEGFAVMIKKEAGYDDDNGDWYYEMRTKDGDLRDDPAPGKVEMCISCHAAAAATDYLAGTHLGNDAGNPDTGGAPEGPGGFAPDFATSDDFFTKLTAPWLGNSPHGKVRIWYSKNIEDLIGNAQFTAPEGTVAIKEFDNDGTDGVDGVVVMVKKESGYDAKKNDWYYEMRDKWGQVVDDPAPGKIAMCADCHAAAAATDYLAGTKIDDMTQTPLADGPGAFQSDYATDGNTFFTQMANAVAGTSPHGQTRIWYSKNIEPVIGQDAFTAPTGTVVVKRFENADRQGLAVMIKKEEGYDPENGNWRYEMRDSYGNILTDPAPGRVEMCITCHSQYKATDYLGGTKLSN